MSFGDIVQSLKKAAFEGLVESLHHFPSHQMSQQKKKKFSF